MDFEGLLMIPGPVQLHERIIKAMTRQMIPHRGKEFSKVIEYCTENLKPLFGTEGDAFTISGSGTAGMEAAISSFSGVNKMTCVDNGKFGERLGLIAQRYTDVDHLRFDWGTSIELEEIERSLENGSEAVAFVHNETSAGILNPAEEIAKLAKEHDALVIMDAITSVGGDEVKMDEWGVDVAVVGSQKCLGIPPGLAAVAVNEEAWNHYNEKCPFYLDLAAYRKKCEEYQTPFTPAEPLYFALEESLKMINEEGLDNRINRHRTFARAVREWALAAGLELFPQLNDYSNYSNTVTAMKLPKDISDKDLRGTLSSEYNITVSGGQAELKGKIFRIGTMGNIGKKEVLATLSAVSDVLRRQGKNSDLALNAATKVLEEL
ncbi:MAG: pyridoxal-phosphate-dependent aminotransferase family protein [Archaeoglobaceae archaeon]